MRLADFLDKGASLHPGAPCLTMNGRARGYDEVRRLSWSVGRALARSGVAPGDKVAILSGNDPVAFGCVFGISRAGAVWCPVNPRNEAAENRELLDLFDCRCLIFAAAFAPLVAKIAPGLPKLATLVCLDGDPPAVPSAVAFDGWLDGAGDEPWQADPVDDVVMIAGTGGTTGKPKGVLLTGHNIETMTALTLMSYPFRARPVYLALAPLTHAAGVLCFPIMTLGGEIVIMPAPDLAGKPGLFDPNGERVAVHWTEFKQAQHEYEKAAVLHQQAFPDRDPSLPESSAASADSDLTSAKARTSVSRSMGGRSARCASNFSTARRVSADPSPVMAKRSSFSNRS